MMQQVKVIICDIDGTLTNCDHRLHFVDPNIGKLRDGEKWQPNWNAFYAAMDEDSVNEWCSEIINHLWSYYKIIFVTRRPEKYRQTTQDWFFNSGAFFRATFLNSYMLFMRPDFLPCRKNCSMKPIHDAYEDNYMSCESYAKEDYKDLRPDHCPAHEVKRDIYEREIKGKYDVLFVLEYDDDCAQMYRDLGLTVLKVMR